MARLQSCFLRAFDLQLLTVCLAVAAASPVAAQPAGAADAEPERVLAAEPETLQEKFEAALLMVRLARPELAKGYIAQMLATEPTSDELLQLRDKFGTATFLGLTNVEALNPEAGQLLQQLTDAVDAKTSDPAYVAQLLPKLSGTARERDNALTELRALGAQAVPAMLQAIETESMSRDVLIYNLTRLGEEAVPPIIGALASPSNKIRSAAAEVLGWLGGKEELIWLQHSAFAPEQSPGVQAIARKAIARIQYGDPRFVARVQAYGSAATLLTESIDYLASRHQWEDRYEDLELIPVWTWDSSQSTVVETRTSRRHAAVYFAERLAREAAELSPTNEDAPIILLAARMVRDIEAAGWDQSVPVGPGTAHDLAVTSGADVCNQVLGLAIDNKIPGAAISAVTALGLNETASGLIHAGRNSELVEALNYPHPRVQFAAAISILQIEPSAPFSGSRRVVEILARALSSDSKPDSVVIDPNIFRGTKTATLFGELGFDSSLAATGMDGFEMAANQGDVELAVLHPNTIRWELTQTIENLQADARTQNLPLVIYGPAALRGSFDRLQDRFQNVVYVNEASSSTDVGRELRPVLAQLSPPPMTSEQRVKQVETAAFWLRWIATCAAPGVFDLSPHLDTLISATNNSVIANDAVIALGSIAVPNVQRRLLEIAEAPAVEVSLRSQAAFQLAFHIQRFGLLLTPAEIERIEAMTSGEIAPELSTALSAVQGLLKPKFARVRKLVLEGAPVASPLPAAGTEE